MSKHCEDLLIGWQEISAYLGVTISTLKVWRDHLKLPVVKAPAPGKQPDKTCASKSALDAWVKDAFLPQMGYRNHNPEVM